MGGEKILNPIFFNYPDFYEAFCTVYHEILLDDSFFLVLEDKEKIVAQYNPSGRDWVISACWSLKLKKIVSFNYSENEIYHGE